MKIRVLLLALGFLASVTMAEAATVSLSPTPVQHFSDNNGNPCSGCLLFTYAAGTTTKLATYTDSTGATANANPVVLNSRGEGNIWLAPYSAYKYVLAPSTDTDPPTNPFWTVDQINSTQSPIVPIAKYGAVCDGTTDDGQAILNAIAAVHTAGGGMVQGPGTACRSSKQIIIPPGVLVQGTAFGPSNPPIGFGIKCDASVTGACVILSGDGTTAGLGNGSAGLEYATVSYSGTPPASSYNVEILGGFNPILDHVMAYNGYNGFGLVGTCTTPPSTGCTFGISVDPDHLYTGAIVNDHLHFVNWPEARITNSRFGMNGTGDLSANSYVYITGGAGGGGQGPNGLTFVADQFNQGANGPAHFMQWASITGAGTNVVEWKVVASHVEDSGSGALFASDSATTALDRLSIIGSTFNTPSRPVFGLNAATQPVEWQITGNEIFCSGLALAPTASIQAVTFADDRINCASHFTSTAGNDTLSLSNDFYGGNLTLDGAGNWGSLAVNGGAFTSGGMVNSTTPSSIVNINVPGSNSFTDCSSTIGISFGGASTGITYGTRSCRWQMVGNGAQVFYNFALTSVGSATGAAQVVGFPKAESSSSYGIVGGSAPYVNNMTGLTGTVGLVTVGSASTGANLTQSSATGTAAVTNANFTNTTQIEGVISYPVQ